MAQLQSSSSFQITSGSFRDSVLAFIPVKIELSGRKNPWMITVPFQCRGGCVCGHDDGFPPEREELIGRIDARRSALQKKG